MILIKYLQGSPLSLYLGRYYFPSERLGAYFSPSPLRKDSVKRNESNPRLAFVRGYFLIRNDKLSN